MIYIASEAKYGDLQLNGLVGMPKEEADNYWQASYDASKAIIDSKWFTLFNNHPNDKSKNYQMIFLEKQLRNFFCENISALLRNQTLMIFMRPIGITLFGDVPLIRTWT